MSFFAGLLLTVGLGMILLAICALFVFVVAGIATIVLLVIAVLFPGPKPGEHYPGEDM